MHSRGLLRFSSALSSPLPALPRLRARPAGCMIVVDRGRGFSGQCKSGYTVIIGIYKCLCLFLGHIVSRSKYIPLQLDIHLSAEANLRWQSRMQSLNVVTRPKRVAKSRAIRAIRRYYAPRFANPWKRLPGHLQTHIKELATEAFCRDHMQQAVLPQLQAAVVERCVKQIEVARRQVDELIKEVVATAAEAAVVNDPSAALWKVHAIQIRYREAALSALEAQETCCSVLNQWFEALGDAGSSRSESTVEEQAGVHRVVHWWELTTYGFGLMEWVNAAFIALRESFCAYMVRCELVSAEILAAMQ